MRKKIDRRTAKKLGKTGKVDQKELLTMKPRLFVRSLTLIVGVGLISVAASFNWPFVSSQGTTGSTIEKRSGNGRVLPLVDLEGEVTKAPSSALPANDSKPIKLSYTLESTYPHDKTAFTQGLLWFDGGMYESTGQHGKSDVRKVNVTTGAVVQRAPIGSTHFGEGIAVQDGVIHHVTWMGGHGFTWDAKTLQLISPFEYKTSNGEGWGITSDGSNLIVSDGSSNLLFWDPDTHTEVKRIGVTFDGKQVTRINELEYMRGYVLANIWFSDQIMVIDANTGKVAAYIETATLYPKEQRVKELYSQDAVLNGIAWDPAEDVLYLTGKLWPRMYKVKVDWTGLQLQ